MKKPQTTFIVNAMAAEDAKLTQEEYIKALITRQAMAMDGYAILCANIHGLTDKRTHKTNRHRK